MDTLSKSLAISIVGLLMNKVKLSVISARKNTMLAEKLTTTIQLLSEQLIPHFIKENKSNYNALNEMHNLCYLLAQKTQLTFNRTVISTCID